ncbi:MAG: tRNA preQ1(34) S-adenosylmethionine ribosyltransferase-isomerase QueA [Deltaproteobacteria bacterium]|nr:tRNA preQ1(34) S-adenosylmethionine ribosyltransferase-isomerase QueA [Deltaproteobacteria bacterium]MBW1795147.1 tRNA preQ1(34) S-adenosylmethionine ribosyltransferase-isomerase QueA [Deltaproteobacteria bacterium]MBW2331591.1 tRNA preQ1(34) S-adenosylmethionine ribosyltransferase-isomerase QueA [Deltaproteobacteria bacterium]
MYSLNDYNYTLPEELIAQVPASPRDESRLMVLEKKWQRVSHYYFADIARLLFPGDLLVVNNTGVVPARLIGSKETGGRVEVLLQGGGGQGGGEGTGSFTCECLVKTSKRPRIGSKFHFDGGLQAIVLGGTDGLCELEFRFKGDFDRLLNRIGQIPLPPYIKRDESKPPPCDDRVCYQTVYAEKKGAVAAPTAGLHFSDEILDKLTEKGVEIVPITLHVGYGTFLPVRVLDVRKHRMYSEVYELTQEAARAINKAKDEGRRIVAVGTTTVRVLEFASGPDGRVRAGSGECDLFIYSGFEFRVIDALITNFHLPETTLLMLVAAFAGRDFILNAYQEAIRRRYRFYSYGDAMLIR